MPVKHAAEAHLADATLMANIRSANMIAGSYNRRRHIYKYVFEGTCLAWEREAR